MKKNEVKNMKKFGAELLKHLILLAKLKVVTLSLSMTQKRRHSFTLMLERIPQYVALKPVKLIMMISMPFFLPTRTMELV